MFSCCRRAGVANQDNTSVQSQDAKISCWYGFCVRSVCVIGGGAIGAVGGFFAGVSLVYDSTRSIRRSASLATSTDSSASELSMAAFAPLIIAQSTLGAILPGMIVGSCVAKCILSTPHKESTPHKD